MILTRSTRLSQPANAAGVDSRFGGRNDWLIAPGSPGSLPISGVVPTNPDQYGSSHYFDGASLQVLGNDANVNATGGQFTLLAYAKFDGTSDDRGVVGNRATTGANAYAQIVHRAAAASRRIVFTYKGTSASAEVGILSAEQSVPVGSTQLVAMVVNGTSVRCYVGSELVGSGVSTAPAPSGHLPYLRAGNYYDYVASRRFRGGIYYAGLLPVALSGEDIGALARNPWQLFRPVQRRVYFDMGAGGGAAHIVTADPVEQGSTTTRPGLTQTHVTTARAVAQGATVSRPVITQTHVVEARPNLQASIVARPSVTQTHVVTARAVAQGSTVNAPSIVQTHIVTARPAAQGGTVTRPGQAQGHQAGSTRPGFEMSSRKVYVKRGKRIHIFDTVEDADEWLEAEDKARQVVNVAKPNPQAKAKVFKALDEAVPHDVVRLDVVRSMVDYLGIPVEMPTLEARQDWDEVARVALMARHMQDEEDIELLLVA